MKKEKSSIQPKVAYPYMLTNIFLVLAFSLFILWFSKEGYQNMQATKQGVFYLLFGGYLALMALFSVELMLVGKLKCPNPKKMWGCSTWVQRGIVLYWLVSVLSTLASPHRAEAMLGMTRGEGLLTITLYCGTFLCVSCFGRMEKRMLIAFGITMMIFSGIALLQMQGYNPLSLYPAGCNYFDADIKYPGIYLSTAGNAGLMAALLSMAIALLGVLLLRSKEKTECWMLIPFGLSLAALLQSGIQAGILAVLVGVLLILPAVLPTKNRKKLWLASGGIFLLGFVAVLLIPVSGGTVYELQQILRGNWDGDFGTGRIRMWREVLKLVPQRLLLGAGPDTMAAAQVMRSVDGAGGVFYVDVAHNEYLNILYHQGILGLLPYLAALGCCAVQWLKKSPENEVAAALGSAVLCYCLQAFFSFSMCQSAGIFWILWGLLESEFYITEGRT